MESFERRDFVSWPEHVAEKLYDFSDEQHAQDFDSDQLVCNWAGKPNCRLILRAESDAVPAPLASHDAVQGAREQAQAIADNYLASISYLMPAWRSFPRRQRQNPSAMVTSRCGVFLAGIENLCHQTAPIQIKRL
jgi:hypothetical protein